MQIVLVATTYPAARRPASEPSYTAIAQELARRGHRVTALACRDADDEAREVVGGVQVVRALGRRSTTAAATRIGPVAGQCRALRAALKGPSAPALLFADSSEVSAALLGVPGWASQWVDLGYDWPLTAFAASHPWWQRARGLTGISRLKAMALGAAIDPPDVQKARFLVWNRERWEQLLTRGLPVQSAHVLRPGIDTRLFAFSEPGSSETEFRLQYQGPLRRDGGLNAVFLGLQRLPARVRLRIVAESTEESYLAELAELGRAAGVMERVDVMPAAGEAQRLAVLREAHAFVHSSESAEEFPRYALEAASAGVPVVAARVAGAGESGWIWGEGAVLEFPAGDPRGLAEGVDRLLGEPDAARTRARVARRLVDARFGDAYTVDQLEPLLGPAPA